MPAGKTTMSCIILYFTCYEAVKVMVAINIYRSHIIISEKAFAFGLKMECAKMKKKVAELILGLQKRPDWGAAQYNVYQIDII